MNDRTTLIVLELIDIVAAALKLAPDVKARFDALRGEVRAMVAAGEGPSDEQLNKLVDRARELCLLIVTASVE